MADKNSSVAYAPGMVPADAWHDGKQLQQFLEMELLKIKAAIDLLAAGHIDKTYAAPAKLRDGDIRYADGTTWNPGSGQGIYYYKLSGPAWVFLG